MMINASMNVDVTPRRSAMSRLQLALNVSDLDAAVEFYSKLFDASPSKRMPGYANFAIADPPLKLVLIEGEIPGDDGTPASSTISASRSCRPARSARRRPVYQLKALRPARRSSRPVATRCKTRSG
jgi:catechol 2,3-dioxygenase-like lactoylglutathione lyase family enzyme